MKVRLHVPSSSGGVAGKTTAQPGCAPGWAGVRPLAVAFVRAGSQDLDVVVVSVVSWPAAWCLA